MLRIVLDFHPEAPCNAKGGICTLASNCPHEIKGENVGLCPEQQPKGAECCNESEFILRQISVNSASLISIIT